MTEFFNPSDFCAYPRGKQSSFQAPRHKKGIALADILEKSSRRIIRYSGLEPHFNLRFEKSRFDALSDLLFAHFSHVARISGKNYILALKTPLMEEIAKRFLDAGLRFDWLESSSPVISQEVLKEHLRPRTGLVILPWICPYTGVVQPVVETLAFLKEETDAYILLDATNAIGNLFFELKDFKAEGYLFEIEDKGAILATLPITPWEKGLRNFSTTFEIEKLDELGIALEKRWLELESRSFERARMRSSFEDEIEEMGWKVHFTEFDRIGDITCIGCDLHPDHLSYLLQKWDLFIDYNETASSKIASFMSDENSFSQRGLPLVIRWPDEMDDALMDRLLRAFKEIQKKAHLVKQETAHVL